MNPVEQRRELAAVEEIAVPELVQPNLTAEDILRIRRAKGGRAQDRIGKGRSYVPHETPWGAAAARRRRQRRALRARMCERLLGTLPPYTAPLSTVESIHVHQSADGVRTLVGSWPHIVAFSIELLVDVPPDFLRLKGAEISITLSDASATYQAFARDLFSGDIVAEWMTATEVPV
jgi:hypothetical protein